MEGIPMQGVDESLAEISQKLLEGWKLLETPCPISNFPLVEKDGRVYSVRCQMDVVLPPGGVGTPSSVPNASTVVPDDKKRQVFRLLRMGFKLSKDKCPISGGPLFVKGADQFSLLEDRMINGAGDPRNDPNAEDVEITEVYNNNPGAANSGLVGSQTFGGASKSSPSPTEPDLDNTRLRLLAWEHNKAAWTQRVSSHLLSGWKMLNDSCPVTHAVPLMQNQDGQNYSPALDDFVDGLSDHEVEEKGTEIVRQYVKDMSPNWDNASSRLVAKGWTVLHNARDPVVPSVPLFRNPAGDLYSVVLQREMPDDFVVVDVPPTSQFPRADDTDPNDAAADSTSDGEFSTDVEGYDTTQSADSSSDGEISTDVEAYDTTQSPEEQKRRDDWSSQLSVLMLKGWRMLSEHCPETGAVPLMQARGETRRYSVATGKYYDEEGNELKEEGGNNANTTNAAAAPAAAAKAASPTRKAVGPKAPDAELLLSTKSQLAGPTTNESNSASRSSSLPHASSSALPRQAAPASRRQHPEQPAGSTSHTQHHAPREHPHLHPVSNNGVVAAYRQSLSSALGAVTRKVEWLQRQVDETQDMPTLESLLHCLSSAVACADGIATSLEK